MKWTICFFCRDINNNAAVASVISTVSLEDLLVPVEIIVTERDIGFFVATIVLSVLLLLIIALATIWFYLKRYVINDIQNKYFMYSDFIISTHIFYLGEIRTTTKSSLTKTA